MTKEEDQYSHFSEDHKRFGAEREYSPSLRLKALIFAIAICLAFWSFVAGLIWG
ncbi:hypothetical protein [Pararhizobium sp. O133]|uniref:hypothetical protein n=1 Tax=Pararhizobium sp. O133 TaxID=3449278 RepID=UPI003F686755